MSAAPACRALSARAAAPGSGGSRRAAAMEKENQSHFQKEARYHALKFNPI